MKIISVSAMGKFEFFLSNIKLLVDNQILHPITYINTAELSKVALSIHRRRLLNSLAELSKYIEVKFYQDVEKVIIDVPLNFKEEELRYFIGCETLDILNDWKYEDGVLIADEYLASLIIDGFVNCLKYHALYSREVVFDDEAFQSHLLFKGNDGKYYVLKTGDARTWLNVYSRFEDAIEDYMTVDYGWKGWSPLQAQPLKVKPEAHREFDVFPSLVLPFVRKYGIEKLLDAKEVKVREMNLDKKILAYLFVKGQLGEPLGDWICNWDYALAPSDVSMSFEDAVKLFIPKGYVREEEELDNLEKKLREEKERTWKEKHRLVCLPKVRTFKGRDGKIIARYNGKIVLFSNPPKEAGKDVVMVKFEERDSRQGGGRKYIKCFEWAPHPHPEIEMLEKRIKELEKKIEEVKEKKVEVLEKYLGKRIEGWYRSLLF